MWDQYTIFHKQSLGLKTFLTTTNQSDSSQFLVSSPFLLVWLKFSICSAYMLNNHSENQEKRSSHYSPANCLHILRKKERERERNVISCQCSKGVEQFNTQKQDAIRYKTAHKDSMLPVYETLLCVTEHNKDKRPWKSLDCLSQCAPWALWCYEAHLLLMLHTCLIYTAKSKRRK